MDTSLEIRLRPLAFRTVLIIALLLCAATAHGWTNPVARGEAAAVAVDAAGNVIVIGTETTDKAFAEEDVLVAKTDGANGALLWSTRLFENSASQRFSDEDEGVDVQIDSNGDVLAVMRLGIDGFPDDTLTAIKLSGTDGSELWRTTAGNETTTVSPIDSAVDASGDLIVVGVARFRNDNRVYSRDPYALKFDGATGAILWERTLPPADGSSSAYGIDLFSNGDAAISGNFTNPFTDSRDVFLTRVSGATGAIFWVAVEDGDGDTDHVLFAPAVDSSDDVYLSYTGRRQADVVGSNHGVFTVKYVGATGTSLWKAVSGGVLEGGNINPAEIAIHGTGDLIVTGGIRLDPAELTDAVIVLRLSQTDGSETWRTTLPAYGDRHDDFGFNVAVTGSGDVVVAGQASNVDGATGEDVVVALLDGTSGTPLWTRHENGAPSAQTPAGGNGNDFPMGLAVDSGGNPVLALHFNQNSTAEPREDRLVAARFDGATGDSAEFPGGRSFSAKTIGSGLRIRARLEDDQAIRVPTSLTPQAPDTAGAMLTLTNPSTAETATVSLPASGWREARPGSTRRAYQYKDSSGADGPCRKAKISAGRIKLDCKGAFGFSLNEAQQGELAVVFTHGSPETRLCTLFQGGNVRKDEPGVFEGKRQAADRSCPTGLP